MHQLMTTLYFTSKIIALTIDIKRLQFLFSVQNDLLDYDIFSFMWAAVLIYARTIKNRMNGD